jgi:hypothetical protein
MPAMDRRLFLNIIIVAILSFYFIFGIAFRGLMEDSEPDLLEASPWEQPFLIPKGWQLVRIEFPTRQLTVTESGWSLDGQATSEQANLLANNWSGLMIQDVASYQDLPAGNTTLVFVLEQKEPLIYRLVEVDQKLQIYRMNDQRLFSLPAELKAVIWVN